ncbi:MAG TPA: hypothetical protein VIO64_10700 [Pseudobacteroides sp.]|uniref:hypothetical protein n=1 Tax=Pseudobacteroides sp. TaxID=1968840 RepID=UPI002F93DF40
MKYIMLEEILTPTGTLAIDEIVSPGIFITAATLKEWERQGKCKEVLEDANISRRTEQTNSDTAESASRTTKRQRARKLDDAANSVE